MEISLPTLLLFILLFAIIIYWKWDEAKNWATIYEASGMHMGKAQSRFAYLKQRGVRCRMKTITPVGIRHVSPIMATTVRVDVYKKDLHKAYSLLAEFRE